MSVAVAAAAAAVSQRKVSGLVLAEHLAEEAEQVEWLAAKGCSVEEVVVCKASFLPRSISSNDSSDRRTTHRSKP